MAEIYLANICGRPQVRRNTDTKICHWSKGKHVHHVEMKFGVISTSQPPTSEGHSSLRVEWEYRRNQWFKKFSRWGNGKEMGKDEGEGTRYYEAHICHCVLIFLIHQITVYYSNFRFFILSRLFSLYCLFIFLVFSPQHSDPLPSFLSLFFILILPSLIVLSFFLDFADSENQLHYSWFGRLQLQKLNMALSWRIMSQLFSLFL